MGSQGVRAVLLSAITVLIASMLFAFGFLLHAVIDRNQDDQARAVQRSAVADGLDELDPKLLDEIIAILQEDFVDQTRIDRELLLQGAVQGIFTSLNDPHSTYIDPRTYSLSRGDFSGAFQGIGATVAKDGDYVVISRPLPDTPAERAGIRAGDRLLSVNGEDAFGWGVQKAALKIRGPRGTTVEIKVRRADGSEHTFKIVRDEVLVASIDTTPPTRKFIDTTGAEVKDLAYIHIRSFTSRSPKELSDAVEAAQRAGAKGLILDVRGNPGGLLRETAQITDMFLEKGTILAQIDRDGREQRIEARAGNEITKLPLVIVQDETSASGSEVLAAALQENGRATVVGSKSLGKGTVNHARELSNGGAVYVSIARWLTPKGAQIEGQGVQPDVAIALTADDIEQARDVAILRAIELLRSGTPVRAAG
ncbi:MAG: S41 family peptidase [Chloroflexi bacterium]|nr:S41 family peptidase [Chloroflexota bacterium]